MEEATKWPAIGDKVELTVEKATVRILFPAMNVILISVCSSQDYPLWFIHQGELSCEKTAVGYVDASMYQNSAVADAFR